LRDHLVEHKLAIGREDDRLLFGRNGSDAFNGKNLHDRADDAWAEAGLCRITPHECRHTFASLMIAAGVNAKALSTYMGHANISITLDRYGHLMPGNEGKAAGSLDAYPGARGNGPTRRRGWQASSSSEAFKTSSSRAAKDPVHALVERNGALEWGRIAGLAPPLDTPGSPRRPERWASAGEGRQEYSSQFRALSSIDLQTGRGNRVALGTWVSRSADLADPQS
jgi:Phage integrase family